MREAKEFQIKTQERHSYRSIALIWAGSVVSVPALMVGGIIGNGISLGWGLAGIVNGYLIICIYMSLMGMEACDTGMPTAMLAAGALGKKGAQYIISTILAVACIGWFGIQAGVCGTAFAAMFENLTGIAMPAWLASVLWGIVMLTSACFRFDGLKKLNRVAVPFLFLVFLLALFSSFKNGDISSLHNYIPKEPIGYMDVVSLTVGHFAVGGAIAGDYCRFARSRGDVVKSSFLGVMPAGILVLLLGAVLFIVTGNYNISAVLEASGMPVLGLFALVLTSWTTNVANAYSGGLNLAILLNQNEDKSRVITAVAGCLGTALAAMGILQELKLFLSLLTTFVPPLVGPVIAEYWICQRGQASQFKLRPGFYAPGMIAFLAGAATALLTKNTFFIGPINGIVVAVFVHLGLSKLKDMRTAG